MAPTSKKKISDKKDVVNAKRAVSNKSKSAAPPRKTSTIAVIKTPSRTKGEKMQNKDLMNAAKSGFIKINKKATLNEVTGKSTEIKYTITPKGAKYIKDTSKAYSKDPMKLRPKLVSEKTWVEKLSKKQV
jgi:hypothetical protein